MFRLPDSVEIASGIPAPESPPQENTLNLLGWGDIGEDIVMSFRVHATTIAASILAGIVVIDGDTIRVDGQRYRLESCDAPETFPRARCWREHEFGEVSKRRLQQLIEGGYAEIERTGRNCKWGRPCINLYVDGVNACDVLISEGYAAPFNRRNRTNWCD